jgi:tetratricopeptide (TPR) repeat protein
VEAQEEALSLNSGLRSEVQNQRQLQYISEMQAGAQFFRSAQQNQDQATYRNAASYFQAARTIFPDSASAYLNEAYAMINAGDQEGAITPMEGYVERSDSVAADQYTLLGQLYITNDRAEDAIPVLEDGADQYPDNSDIQSLLLNAYNSAGQTEQAIAAYQQQVENNPNNALYLYNLGSLLLNENRYDEAMTYLERAVEAEPSNANAQYNYGAAHVNKAVAINDSIATMEDSLRANENDLSESELQELESTIQELADERQQLFQDAIPPLERARELAGSDSQNRRGICRALFSAYVQTEQQQQAEQVQDCAGFSDQQINQQQ